jgi:hypothetical protein
MLAMSNHAPFTLHIFVVNGDPDGLRLVERSNWIGKAVIFPRAIYPHVRGRPEFQEVGVYLLLGPREGGDGEAIYVGEGDPVRPRLEDHYAKKDFWTRAVFFVAPGQLSKTDVQYLEAKLVSQARLAKRVPLENGNFPSEPTISERDRASMDVFLDNILGMLPVLGINAFEQSIAISARTQTPLLTCQGRGVSASGLDTPQGFVVRAGSEAASEEVPSLREHFPATSKFRADLIQSGVLVPEGSKLRFAQDYTFNSPSMASSIVLGRSSNGRTDWKNSDGRTLKELQEAQARS